MPLSLPDYQRRVATIRDTVSAQLGALWLGLPNYRDESVDRFVRLAVPKVHAGQIATARATVQYLGGSVMPRDQIVAVRPVDPAVEYRRPAVRVYTDLAAGKSLRDAVSSAASLVGDLVSTDMQLAKTHQSRASLSAGGYRYYRRVLSGSENCAICVIASTQRYHRGDLMPVHPGCDCSVEPVDASFDPGQVLDSELLEATHFRVQDFTDRYDRGARDLGLGKTTAQGRPVSDFTDLIVTHDHGEYGPTLAWRGDKFTGPGDIAD